MQKLRRCHEDRWDFTAEDAPFFPISISKGGPSYNFCPGKATWDLEAVQKFRILIITAESGTMLDDGGIKNQQDWYIELLGWFLPLYDQIKWSNKMKSIFGDGKKNTGQRPQVASGSRQTKAPPRRARR